VATSLSLSTESSSQSSFQQKSVSAVRRFNRFYTRQIGVLQEGLLKSPFSLTELRVLYEIAHRSRPSATELSKELGVDPGYLSRTLRDFVKRGLIRKLPSETDGRQAHLELTKPGRQTFAKLDARSSEEVASMLDRLAPAQQKELVESMRRIEQLLNPNSAAGSNTAPYVLRPHQPGDMGWVVHRHGVVYSREYEYDEGFEALVAGIVAEFIERFDAKRERCWIAEKDGEIIGCVFLVKQSKTIAKLRLLLVEPTARGMGLGKRLVTECVRFARQAGYKKIVLWTQSELGAARRIYESAGFRLAGKQPHHSWGRDLVAETWELKL
jgi:DNA-binding MarR family transcriptional regulator/N-acetylglutamate synthase-like GNAT family acetyltransferase